MVFPAYGIIKYSMLPSAHIIIEWDKPVYLEGICLNCGEQGKKYTVKFVPGDLWVMEQ